MRFILAAIAAALLWAGTATAATPLLKQGDHGPKVAGLQWLLHGGKPNVFTKVKPTFAGRPNGYFGPRTARAITVYKWRLGYPKALVRPIAGPYLFRLLKGQSHRPAAWVALAAKRLKAIEPGFTLLALRIKGYEISQLGVNEQPPGSNLGQQVLAYQADTGAYGLAWCVSFQQHSFRIGGYGWFADRTASVYTAADWAATHGYLRARAKVGALVAFIDYYTAGTRRRQRIPGTGHMGYVVKVGAGWFVSVEGNTSNGVRQRFHRIGDRAAAFIYLPRVATG
jgi:hypothetical protein